MRRLLSSKSPLVAGAIPFLIWVAGAHVFVGYVAVMQAMGLREQAKMTMWQNLGVALIGAIGGGILAWVSLGK